MEITKTTVFVYKGVLGIQSSNKSEGLLNTFPDNGKTAFVYNASKVEFSQEAIDWLKKIRQSNTYIWDLMVYEYSTELIVFGWVRKSLEMFFDPDKLKGYPYNYNSDLLIPTENVKIPEEFKKAVDKYFEVEEIANK